MARIFAAVFAVCSPSHSRARRARSRPRSRLPTSPRSSRRMPTSRKPGYADSLAGARQLKTAVDALIKEPTDANLKAARQAWLAARVPYMQTEAFRFGNKIVDDWERQVNSWPLDEGLIDYVSPEYGAESPENDLYVANVIANTSIKIGGETVDTSKITKELLDGQAAGGGRRRGQRRDRLSRHRVPAVGPGPQRHRTRRRQPARDRLRHQEVHRRPLRAPRAIPADRHRPAGRRPRLDGAAVGRRTAPRARPSWRTAARPASAAIFTRPRQPLLRRDGGRAHEARPADPRSRGGARLLLRQHAQLALLRRASASRTSTSAPTRAPTARSSRGRAPPTSCAPSRAETDDAHARRARRDHGAHGRHREARAKAARPTTR